MSHAKILAQCGFSGTFSPTSGDCNQVDYSINVSLTDNDLLGTLNDDWFGCWEVYDDNGLYEYVGGDTLELYDLPPGNYCVYYFTPECGVEDGIHIETVCINVCAAANFTTVYNGFDYANGLNASITSTTTNDGGWFVGGYGYPGGWLGNPFDPTNPFPVSIGDNIITHETYDGNGNVCDSYSFTLNVPCPTLDIALNTTLEPSLNSGCNMGYLITANLNYTSPNPPPLPTFMYDWNSAYNYNYDNTYSTTVEQGQTGYYSVNIYDTEYGCTYTAATSISEPYVCLDASFTPSVNAMNVSLNAFENTNDEWSVENTATGNITNYPSGTTSLTLNPGSYTIYHLIYDCAGSVCNSSSENISIVCPPMTVDFYTVEDNICGMGDPYSNAPLLHLYVDGVQGGFGSTYTYSWYENNYLAQITTNPYTTMGQYNGTASVVVTDEYGCIGTSSTSVSDAGSYAYCYDPGYYISMSVQNGHKVVISPTWISYFEIYTSTGQNVFSGSSLQSSYNPIGISYDSNGDLFFLSCEEETYFLYEYFYDCLGGLCFMGNNITVTTSPALSTTITGNTSICAGASTTLTASTNNGTAPYTYNWNSGQTANAITVSPTSTINYNVSVTDAVGCTAAASQSINILPSPPISAAGSNTCVGNTISLSASGGSIYTWSGPNGFTSNAANPSIPNATTNMSGVYSVSSVNSNSCTSTASATVIVDNAPVVSATGSSVIVGSVALLSANGGSTYNWSGPDNFSSNLANPTISNASFAADGTYTVMVTNASGCSASATANITIIPINVTVSASGNTSFCNGQSVVLYATSGSGLYFQWQKDGVNISGASNTSYTATQAGNYTVAVSLSSSSYPTISNAITVTILAPPVADAGLDKTICYGGAATSIGTAAIIGNTYSWTPTTGLNSSTTAKPNANPTATTTYTLTVKNTATGCTATDQVEVYKNPLLTINAGTDQSVCKGSSASLTATVSGGTTPYIYTWTPSTTVSTPTNATTNVTPTANTNYTAKVTDAKGCIKTDVVLVSVKALPTANAGTTQLSCGGSAVQIGSAAINGYSYTWAPSAGLSNANVSNPTASVTSATTYTVTASFNGCQKTASVLVNAQAIPTTTTISASSTSVCQGTAVTLTCTATGATTYKWYNATTLAYLGAGATYTIPATTAAGTYSYICRTYTSSTNTCYATSNILSVTIKEAPVPTITASNGTLSGTNLTVCYGTLPIIFTGSVSGTYQPSSWQWQFSATNTVGSYTNIINGATPTLTAHSKDYYQLKVNYPNGCSKTALRRIILNLGCKVAQTIDADNTEEELVTNTLDLDISPNPTDGLINLNLEDISFQTAKVKVINSLGQIVLETELNFDEGEQEKQVDLSKLEAGIYYLHFITNNEEVTKKVVKL